MAKKRSRATKRVELNILKPPAPVFTRASALRWMRGERLELMLLLGDIAEYGGAGGYCSAAYYLADDIALLVTAATDAIASDRQIPLGYDEVCPERAFYLAELLAFRAGRGENLLCDATDRLLDRFTVELRACLEAALSADVRARALTPKVAA